MWIKCSVPEYKNRNIVEQNRPINLGHILTFYKPYNGSEGYKIYFIPAFSTKEIITWSYTTQKQRDDDYEFIMNKLPTLEKNND